MTRISLQTVLSGQAGNAEHEGSTVPKYLEQLDARSEYIARFRRLETQIEECVSSAPGPEPVRAAQLVEAERLLFEVPIEHSDELGKLSDCLESKLEEMVCAIRGDWRGATPRSLPEGLPDAGSLSNLLRPVAVKARRLLIHGRIEWLLYQYCDQGRVVTRELRDKRVEQVRRRASKLREAAEDLAGHFLIDLVGNDRNLSASVEAAARANAELVARLEQVAATSEYAGITSLLRANGNELRNQYVVSCATACLATYGNVSVDLLKPLLALKEVGYLPQSGKQERRNAPDSVRRQITRLLDIATHQAVKIARERHLHIQPILKVFCSDPAFGRGAVQQRPSLKNEGLPEYVDHSS